MVEVEAVARRLLRPGGVRDSARGRGEKKNRRRRTSRKWHRHLLEPKGKGA